MTSLLDVPLSARAQGLALRGGLDLKLAASTDPDSSGALRPRAAQLCPTRTRRAVARLRRTIAAARSAPDDRRGYAPLARGEDTDSYALLEPGRRSEAEWPVEPLGVAPARVLTRGADRPLVVGAEPGTPRAPVPLATVALDLAPAPGWRPDGT